MKTKVNITYNELTCTFSEIKYEINSVEIHSEKTRG